MGEKERPNARKLQKLAHWGSSRVVEVTEGIFLALYQSRQVVLTLPWRSSVHSNVLKFSSCVAALN